MGPETVGVKRCFLHDVDFWGALLTEAALVNDRGELAFFDNQIDLATGSSKLKATFLNAELRLWRGSFDDSRCFVG